MSPGSLAQFMRQAYDNTPFGEQNTFVILFGIKYAKDFSIGGNANTGEVVDRAGLPKGWVNEIRKGINLANYVSLNDGDIIG